MAAPDAPSSPTPAQGTRHVDHLAPTLTWLAPGATSCRVYISVFDQPSFFAGAAIAAGGGRFGFGGVGILGGGVWTFDRNSGGIASGGLAQILKGAAVYWRVVAVNADGETPGPLWEFVTENPPDVPTAESPSDTAINVPVTHTLTWTAAAATSYDVYFGTTNPPPLVSSGQAGASYDPDIKFGGAYYWKIVAINSEASVAGPVWSFSATVLSSPTATVVAGAGIDVGAHEYAYTVVDGSSESFVSGRASAVTHGQIGTPSAPTVATSTSGFSGGLTPGATYKYKVTYSTASSQSDHSAETDASAASAGVVANATGTAFFTAARPVDAAVQWVHFYRTLANGSTYFLSASSLPANVPAGPGNWFIDQVADAGISGHATAPGVNTAPAFQSTAVYGIAPGPAGTTARKIYRTVAGGTQLKLVTTLSDNVTTTYTDSTPDASLGANAP
jgi:hypothetical protein